LKQGYFTRPAKKFFECRILVFGLLTKYCGAGLSQLAVNIQLLEKYQLAVKVHAGNFLAIFSIGRHALRQTDISHPAGMTKKFNGKLLPL
jgi:hypothetical protein